MQIDLVTFGFLFVAVVLVIIVCMSCKGSEGKENTTEQVMS